MEDYLLGPGHRSHYVHVRIAQHPLIRQNTKIQTMSSAEKQSPSKVAHVYEGHPSFCCSNCSAVIVRILVSCTSPKSHIPVELRRL